MDIIRDYIQKVTQTQNVIVLLPNLNWICRELINAITKLERMSAPVPYHLVSDEGATGGVEGPDTMTKSVKSNQDIYYKIHYESGWLWSTIKKLLAEFGLEFSASLANPGTEKDSTSMGVKNWVEVQDEAVSITERYKLFNDTYWFLGTKTSVVRGNEGAFPQYDQQLKGIFSRILKNSSNTYGGHVTTLYETDMKVLDYWASDEFTKSFLFGGKDEKFTEGNPAVIWGDRQLIKDYLYGNSSPPTKQKNPLHPEDSKVLEGGEYRQTIRKIALPSPKAAAPFGNYTDIPEDFTFHDEALYNDLADAAQKARMPIFRYNTKNANVLDMRFQWENTYFAALNMGFQKEVARKATVGAAKTVLPQYREFGEVSTDDLTAYVLEKEISMGAGDIAQRDIIYKFLNWVGREAPESVAQLALALNQEYLKTKLRPMMKVGELKPGDPNKMMESLIEDAYRRCNMMTITTVPYFSFSNNSTLRTWIALFAQDSPILQTKRPQSTPMNKFISGVYQIVGFEHNISSREAVTKFSLVKSVVNTKAEGDMSGSMDLPRPGFKASAPDTVSVPQAGGAHTQML